MALRAEADRLGIPPERCLCTGDVVAYCAEPVETADLIRGWGCPVVMGNCEESFAQNAEDCGCGFEEASACDVLLKEWFAFASARLDARRRAWMGELPRMIRFEWAGRTVAAIHGAADEINRYIFASTPAEEKCAQAELAGADIVLAGHCGIPFTQKLPGGRVWHNAGAIGMPANDGTPESWYSLLIPGEGAPRFEHRRLSYDHEGAASAMRAACLPEGYARALETGLWPSLDVLPPAERAAMGKPLVSAAA